MRMMVLLPTAGAVTILFSHRTFSAALSAAAPHVVSALSLRGSRATSRVGQSHARALAPVVFAPKTRRSRGCHPIRAATSPTARQRLGRSCHSSSWYHASDPSLSSCSLSARRRRLFSRMSSGLSAQQSDDLTANENDALQLVDVDCNLWHKDLKPLIPALVKQSSQGADRNDGNAGRDVNVLDNDEDDSMLSFAIVDDDDMSHCAALLSPSSTVREAQIGLQSLLLRQQKHHRSANDDGDVGSSTTASNGDGATTVSSTLLPIRTTVGIHPYHVNDEDCRDVEGSRRQLQELLTNPSCAPHIAAVGECGLDASPGFPPLPDQIPYFRMQVELACAHNQPLFVHERLAFESCCRILDEVNCSVPVIIHCFTGTRDECAEYIRRGYYVSVSGYIFKDEALGAILEEGIIPLDRLMVETDAPYMGFAGCRSRYLNKHSSAASTVLNAKQRKKLVNGLYPNVPSSLRLVFDKVWEHVNAGRVQRQEPELSRAELARITTHNAIQFFGFDVPLPVHTGKR